MPQTTLYKYMYLVASQYNKANLVWMPNAEVYQSNELAPPTLRCTIAIGDLKDGGIQEFASLRNDKMVQIFNKVKVGKD